MKHRAGCASLSVAIAPDWSVGVCVREFNSRHSRMQTWNPLTLELGPFQDIKARVELIDISPEGKYVAYRAVAHHRQESYLAISKPPYFHALFLKSGSHNFVPEALFAGDQLFIWTVPGRYPDIDHETVGGIPFGIEPLHPDTTRWKSHEPERARRCAHWYPKATGWTVMDPQGRVVSLADGSLTVDGQVLFDLGPVPFTEVATPHQARSW